MIRPIFALIAAAAALPAAALPTEVPAATCAGPAPAITSAKVQSVQTNDQLNEYTLVGTVTNVGDQSQAKNVIQTVHISDGVQNVDAKGIPPLAAGQSYQFTYVWPRNVNAGNGTTTFRFDLDTPSGACTSASDIASVTF